MLGVAERLQGCPPETILARVGTLSIILLKPFIHIGLQFLQRGVDLLAKGNRIKLLLYGAVEAFADAVGLRALGLGARVIDVLDREIELVFVPLRVAAILAAAVGQHAQQLDVVAIEEGNDPVARMIFCSVVMVSSNAPRRGASGPAMPAHRTRLDP